MNFSTSGQPRGLALSIRLVAFCAAVPLALCLASSPGYALSEIKREDLPSPVTPPADDDMSPPGNAAPTPGPLGATPPAASPDEREQVEPGGPT
ncbi:MAG: hypothetical protein E5X64_13200, partial [Mesorhizobium sp.]